MRDDDVDVADNECWLELVDDSEDSDSSSESQLGDGCGDNARIRRSSCAWHCAGDVLANHRYYRT